MSMKEKMAAMAVLVGLAAIPAVSWAAPANPGPYMSFFLGASVPQDTTVTVSEFNPVSIRESRAQFDPGINIGGTAGYDFGFMRLEGEMSYKEGEITTVTNPALNTRYVNTDGELGAFAMMMNSFFDIHNETPITPYFGGGVGFADVSLSNTKGVEINTGALNYHVFSSDDAAVFAYQVGGGMEVAMNRRLSVDIGYRYFGTSRVSLRNNWPNSTDLRLGSHNGAIGLRIKF